MPNDAYSELLSKRSSELNQHIEDLKKLEAYAVCSRDTFVNMEKFINSQSDELKNLLSSDKITKDTCDISHEVLNNVVQSLKSMQEESLKNYYKKLGATEFIKNDMSDIVNSRAIAQENEREKEVSASE